MEYKAIKLHTAFFRESRTCYTLEDFNKKLGLKDIEKAKKIVAALKRTGIAKAVKKSEFNLEMLNDSEEDYIITDDISTNSDIGYVLNYVGFAFNDDCLIKCYPKYIDDKFNSEDEAKEKIENHFKTVLKVIRRINAKEEHIHLYNGQEDSKVFNRLAVALYLLDDYYANGLYSNLETIIETNGDGEIDWDKTINETFAILKNNKPYYVELQTINTQSNEFDYFKLLHECVLTTCSQELEKAGILELFDMLPVEITNLQLNDFGDVDYIKYRLEKEIQNQFISKKQTLLKTIYTFIAETKSNQIDDSVSLFGTNAFNMVWEKICGETFDNVRDYKLSKLTPFIGEIKEKYNKNNTLKDLIENAKWWFNEKAIEASKTLEPDILRISNNGSRNFYVLDAKYYYFVLQNENIYHQPGIQDVVKQFAYEKAFSKFLTDYNFQGIANAFLIPKKTSNTSDKKIENIGKVTLDFMQYYALKKLGDIQLIEIEPEFIYKLYLDNKKIEDMSYIEVEKFVSDLNE